MKGPGRFRSDGDWVGYRNPEILSGTISYNGRTFQLESNNLSINNSDREHLYVYHMYSYIKDGVVNSGRWYNMKMDVDTFRVLHENTFQIHLTDVGTISLVFSEKIANVLRMNINILNN